MSEIKPPSNKGKKPAYRSVPVKKTNQPIARSSGKPTGKQIASKFGVPKKKKLPTPVIVTNILMIGVILAICGVVFAIAYNNIQYDKADAARSSKISSGVTSSLAAGAAGSGNTSASSTPTSSGTSSPTTSETTFNPPVSGEFSAEFFKDDLFIGDSIFTGLYLYSYIDQQNVAAAVGYTAYGAQVNTFDEDQYSGSATAYAKEKQPKRIIIMLGSNSLSAQTDFADFISGYRGLLNTLKRDCPESVICVVSVPPITSESSMASYSGVTNVIIDTANTKIKELCNDTGVLYYDVNSVLKDSNGYFSEEYADGDGMHFRSSTYPIFLSGVQKMFE